jgi:hypothetical protein
MPSHRITPPAKLIELTADQLELVRGGIIIVSGKTFRSDAILTFSSAIESVARWSFA